MISLRFLLNRRPRSPCLARWTLAFSSLAHRTATAANATTGNPPQLYGGSPLAQRLVGRCGGAVTPRQCQQVRGKKTKTTVRLVDLPQGPLPPPPEPSSSEAADAAAITRTDASPASEEDVPAYPTVVLQARRNMQKFANCVLLTRVGGFYELYFEHAEEFGPLLNLKVAQKRTNAGLVSMAGFPFFQLDRFLKTLVQDHKRYVAIAEEFPNDPSDKIKSGGLMHDRRVARIITPGTLIDENFMDPYANNYVMAIHIPRRDTSSHVSAAFGQGLPAPDATPEADAVSLGLAWLDLSTGCFFTQATSLASLSSVLSRVSPREVVLDSRFQSEPDVGVLSVLEDDRHLVTYAPAGVFTQVSDWAPMLESDISADTVGTFTPEEVASGSLLLGYVKDRLQGLSMKLQPPLRHEGMQIMSIDKNSMRSLEIKQTIRDGAFKGSLLHAIRRTVTKSGARLLNEWLTSPSTSLDVITFRQDLVACFIQHEHIRDNIILLLRRSHDSHRLIQKFALNRGDPDDLLGLASTIYATEEIVNILKEYMRTSHVEDNDCIARLVQRVSLEQPLQLAERIRDAIDEEGLVQQHRIEDTEAGQIMALAQEVVQSQGTEEDSTVLPKTAVAKQKRRAPSLRETYGEDNEVWIMKPGASSTLAELHGQLIRLHDEKVGLAEELRTQFKAQSLTLRWTPGLGHICHIKGKDARNSEEPVRTLSSSRTTKSFHHPSWSALGDRMDKARHQIRGEERRVFVALRDQVVRALVQLRRNAGVLDELDITTSFARLALEQRFVRPQLNNSVSHTIIGGRHPTVEGGLAETGRTFQRNDCLVGAPGHGRVWLITGPNMAGKSTFLRQNALITVLAQAGCYVPADYASLGVVDALFSRVGSADNLYRDQSTFMVEMLETTAILRQATPRSFVIMDEIGRGTTPEDGAAVAFASLHHLVQTNRCRALFATHFHAVADLAHEYGMRCEDGRDGAVETYCTDVAEDERGGFVYVHKLRKGVNRQSHALKVARLAGLPEAAIAVAKDVLGDMESRAQQPSST